MTSAVLDHPGFARPDLRQVQSAAMVEYLRRVILAAPPGEERFHALFLDQHRRFATDAPLGRGGSASLSLRMRELFERALSARAHGLIVAHNHPSGLCRPSVCDIRSTKRLAEIARALDIELIDHLIFTQTSVYSMRAGGDL